MNNSLMKKIFLFGFLLFLANIYAQTEGYAVNNDGSKTYYKTFGKGEPLLIINGGPGMNSNGFEDMAKTLGENQQTIIYDQRGTGKSKLSKLDAKTISMRLMIDDIESLRKHLKIKKWNILGHSFGGMLGSYYATIYPNSINKLILSSSGGVDLSLLKGPNLIESNLSKVEIDSMNYWNDKIEKGDTSHKARLGRGRAMAPAYVYDQKFIPIIAERLTQGNSTINGLLWSDMQKMNFDYKSKLKNFKNPVLIIQGKEDIISNEIGELAHKTFPNSKLILLEHSKHYGWLDAREKYFNDINSFLK
ncbi:alpha/beta fold hydrolase [Flavobacterium johnsoniae]|uniref:Peptidase family S33 n=1 Tax=Flavobacterium johnsoniae (strain ATCC 17061 / DSM 2064 / JCM 8514 / BCRC 14874 / CCUG 350202 / NBRC 14942 / NCIMB 11054 / UW101) TaxID=376686 RepID=A5FM48_FLAJ1|nr:alpha/beta fold hydrolase [Flavobacterium johnsoniae]ABQ03724.1 Peptidase family S33 [Flavobacterium johnsoniae UW101]OXG03247.1 alpha/beta hydrolase [Flavobacterium johnsoniae UW101]WQG79413.1 alpha/beta fold hydrolase [Flavobacterium johnsoniae UW101]